MYTIQMSLIEIYVCISIRIQNSYMKIENKNIKIEKLSISRGGCGDT